MSINLQSVLHHAGALQRATSLRELVEVTYHAVRSETRFRTAWLAVIRPEDPEYVYVVQVAGDMQELVLEKCPRVIIAGDAMLAELIEGKAPVLVLEAATDPRTNKEMVAALGNRTILNVPLVLGPAVICALGVGSFGDEGVIEPTTDELECLVILGTQLAGAITRMQLLDQQQRDAASRRALERSLESLQRVELMGVLAAGVAHDLNNYLAVVHANLEELRLEMPGGTPVSVDDALFATQKASQVVRQLLSLGRAQAERREAFDLSARVASTLQLVRPAVPRSVHLSQVTSPVVIVDGDPVQVEQAVANLLLNARDAVGGDGRIEVEVGERTVSEDFALINSTAKPGRYAQVLVRDSGQGIAPEVLPHIFDPLYSTKRAGTGLGLAVVSRVAQQHGGFVHCNSVVGAGTTFAFCLPAAT